jgi:hypothetical protein
MGSNLVVVPSYPAWIHADLAQSALEASGIVAFVQRGSGPRVAFTVELIVREEDVSAANEILGTDETFSD